jgi:hypothetical protein
MASDRLFEMLAQAKGQPSKALRATQAAGQAGSDILGGYLTGRQLKMQLNQPEAMARLLNATPQGHDIVQTMGPEGATAAMYGSTPKDVLDYAGKAAELKQRGDLGMAGINERNTASQRAYDAALGRTKSNETLFGRKDLSSNIALHENEIQRLTGEQSKLSSQVPGGIAGTVQSLISRGGDIGPYLQDPKFGSIYAQMKANDSQIKFHKSVLEPMYKAQGIIPQGLLDNSDLGGINPPPAGGDNSVVTGLPGFGQ